VSGGVIGLSWTPGKDNVGVERYLVYRGPQLIATTGETSLLIESPPGTYAFAVLAEDAAGLRSPLTPYLSVAVPDLLSPSQPTSVRGSARRGAVELSWAASADDVGIARYLIVRDDGLTSETPVPAFVDRNPPPGRRTYAVYAEDAAGNRSVPGVAAVEVGAPTARPRLAWRRAPGGRLLFLVRAAPGTEPLRLELWVRGRRFGSTKARRLRVRIRPRASWPKRIRVVAVAVEPEGTARLRRMIRTPPGSGRR
jgi:hypothetical protein